MAKKRKVKTREERVQVAAKQMKFVSLLFLFTAFASLSTDKYFGPKKYVYFGIFILLALLLWRQGKPDKLRNFSYFDGDEKKGMF